MLYDPANNNLFRHNARKQHAQAGRITGFIVCFVQLTQQQMKQPTLLL